MVPRPRPVLALLAVLPPVPPLTTAKGSTNPEIVPPVIVTAFAFCVDMVPSSSVALAPLAVVAPTPPDDSPRGESKLLIDPYLLGLWLGDCATSEVDRIGGLATKITYA